MPRIGTNRRLRSGLIAVAGAACVLTVLTAPSAHAISGTSRAALQTADGGLLQVSAPGVTATIGGQGGIDSLRFDDGRTWNLHGASFTGEGTGLSAPDSCDPVGQAQPSGDGATWQTRCADAAGDVTDLTETLQPTDNSLSWTVQVASGGGTFSRGIWTRLSGWDDGHARQFWTTWTDSGVARSDGWSDPLSPTPFANRRLDYGIGATNSYAVPVASIIEPDTDHGLAFVESPNDTVLAGALSTTKGGDVAFGRFNNRLSPGQPVSFHMDLVPTVADWRPGLSWVTRHYPDYFDQVVTDRSTEGLGSYSPYPGPFTAALRSKLRDEDFRTNWELSLRGPYQGEFSPPVASDNVTWEPDLGTFWPQTPKSWSIGEWKRVLDYWDDAGLSNLAYFNASLFGRNIQTPFPAAQYSCNDPERWRSPNDYLRCDFSNAILRRADGTPVGDWRSGVVMDPGDPTYAQHLLDQAKALLTRLPQYRGIAVDQFSHYRSYNTFADDGVTWYQGGPARSLITSWRDTGPRLADLVHSYHKQIWGNSYTDARIDLFKDLDGVFSEGPVTTGFVNSNGFLGLNRPVVTWTSSLGTDPDRTLQQSLYMGVYPMGDAPDNDHGIQTSPATTKAYSDYGPMFAALKGKRWALTPHEADVTSSTAVANVFDTDGGVAVPVVEGGNDTSADLTLRHLQRIHPGVDTEHPQVLWPGQTQWQPLSASTQGDTTTLTVPLVRGAALVRFPGSDTTPQVGADHAVTVGLSTSQGWADTDHPLVLTSEVRNVSGGPLTDVTATLDQPDGWTAARLDTPPAGLAAGQKTTVRWRLTPPPGATGTVGETRVKVGYRLGGTTATASDATRVIAGHMVDPSTITATASSQQASNPGSNAVDGDPSTFWVAPSSASAPASLTLDLHGAQDVSGLTYLPRQDGLTDGWISGYSISVSTDGQDFTPVAQGTWNFDAGLQSASFNAPGVRYVRLTNSPTTCVTPTSGQLTTAAEVGVVTGASSAAGSVRAPSSSAATPADGLGQVVPHENMTATASSQQPGYPASNAIDASVCTIWHTQYSPYQPLPQSITLDLGASYQTNGLAYLPRQDYDNGQITQYVIAVSSDGQTFTDVAQGNWAQDATQKVANWPAVGARYVRLTAVAGNNGGSGSYPQGLASAGDLEVGYE